MTHPPLLVFWPSFYQGRTREVVQGGLHFSFLGGTRYAGLEIINFADPGGGVGGLSPLLYTSGFCFALKEINSNQDSRNDGCIIYSIHTLLYINSLIYLL